MSGGFQTQVYDQPAIGVAGNFASVNPSATYDAGPGGLVAGPGGVTIGRAAWAVPPLDPNNAPTLVNSFGVGNISGLVMNLQQGLNTSYLSYAGMQIAPGFMLSLATGGDFIVVNEGAAQALRGMKMYAGFADGKLSFAVAGAPSTASATTSSIAAGTAATITGSISGNVLNATAVTNTIYAGSVITSGAGVASNTTVLGQISGTVGGIGLYYVNIGEQSVASEAMTLTPYVLDTTGGTVTGTVIVGGVVQTAGTATGTVVGMAIASVYAATPGKWVVAPAPFVAAGTATSGTVTVSLNVETPWWATNSALNGELVKVSAASTGFSSLLS